MPVDSASVRRPADIEPGAARRRGRAGSTGRAAVRPEQDGDAGGDCYYEATVLRPPPQPPLAGRVRADVCVVGAGYAGLSAALELAQRGYSVRVLEARRAGWGASGRNGGQVIVGYGGDGEMAIERQLPAADARRAWDVSIAGLALLHERCRRHAIDCDWQPGHLSLATRPRKTLALQRWMAHVVQAYAHPLRFIPRPELPRWVASAQYDGAVLDAASGHLHPLRYCLGLARAAQAAGAHLHEDSPVVRIERGARPRVLTAAGACDCQFVVLAGNVYLDAWGAAVAPEVSARIVPVGTSMLATARLGRERAAALLPGRAAASDSNTMPDYFRLAADDRLLFGAVDRHAGLAPRLRAEAVRRRLLAVFPQLEDVAVEHGWGGLVDLTLNMAPHFGRLGGNIWFVQGFSGHGVAMAGMAGLLAAEAIAGQAERFDLLARIRHLPVPGGALVRTPALALGLWYYRLRDAL
ncbi:MULTISPECIES: NAD(P)/FAD-dependent oxidoreductase [Ramlibacter]|uniref:FAD-dependent oxidoreductase n=1 Tax=Ramlibacter pinisoli TaxID=2682844 RepID=A0A6N8IMI8_9BURK|nr:MULTISPECIES: FAD-dependent oxidoreductase [Ramlibacter]MBA2960713.1 FAD-dependent oxidoreductase [Ramlibacter sp. CGMCC 1.13660]MVQ28041.1 FAD-dependent oxidoreductase [Ramlibacter pinisoli]